MSVSQPALGAPLLPFPCAIGVDVQHRIVELDAMCSSLEVDIRDAAAGETPQPLLELDPSKSGARLIEHCKCGLSEQKLNEDQLLLLSQGQHLPPLMLDVEASGPLHHRVEARLIERRQNSLIGYFLFRVGG